MKVRDLTATDDTPPANKSAGACAAWAHRASEQGAWDSALRRWNFCIRKFGRKPEWKAKKARALLELGRTKAAQYNFAALAKETPEKPDVVIGLARLALKRQDFADAISLLTRCRETHPDLGTPMLAFALLHAGRAMESEALWSKLTQEHPDDLSILTMRIRAAIEVCRQSGDAGEKRAEIRRQIGDLLLTCDVEFRSQAVGLLESIGDREEATKQLLICVEHVHSLQQIETCFRAVPLHIERGSRGPLWVRLLSRVRGLIETGNGGALQSAIQLELQILLAQERFAEFTTRFDAVRPCVSKLPNYFFLERIRERLGKPRHEVFAEPKVFGIGLTKTGTTSLSDALVALGFDAAHWTNPLTHQLLADIDIFLFGAASDTSVSQEFEKLYYQYPNARFVLTRRPVEAWRKSFEQHHARSNWASALDELRDVYDREHNPFAFSAAPIQFGLYLNAADLDLAWRIYEKRVRHFFSDKPAGKLLELDIFAGHGWTELCNFLDRPIPDRPFPWSNPGS